MDNKRMTDKAEKLQPCVCDEEGSVLICSKCKGIRHTEPTLEPSEGLIIKRFIMTLPMEIRRAIMKHHSDKLVGTPDIDSMLDEFHDKVIEIWERGEQHNSEYHERINSCLKDIKHNLGVE